MRGSDKEDTPAQSSKPVKSGNPTGCIPNVFPQQQRFEFEELTLDSCFDSGNMGNASRISETHV
jgi:hypothetical protein